MTTTLLQVREAITALLDDIPDLNAYDAEPAQARFPAAVVGLPDIKYYDTFGPGGLYEFDLPVYVFEKAQIIAEASKTLAKLCDVAGDLSVFAVLSEQNATLGGLVDDVTVMTVKQLGRDEYADVPVLACEFTVHVKARRPTA